MYKVFVYIVSFSFFAYCVIKICFIKIFQCTNSVIKVVNNLVKDVRSAHVLPTQTSNSISFEGHVRGEVHIQESNFLLLIDRAYYPTLTSLIRYKKQYKMGILIGF